MAFLLNTTDLTAETEVSVRQGLAGAPGEPRRAAHVAAGVAPFRDNSPDIADFDAAHDIPRCATPLATGREGCDVYVCNDLDAVGDIWKKFQETAELTPFQRFEWLRHWYCSFSNGRIEPFVVLVYEAGRLVLIAPLAIETGYLTRRLIWLGHSVNDHNAPIVDAEWLAQLDGQRASRLWRLITRHAERVDYLHLIRSPGELAGSCNPFLGDAPQAYSSDSHYLRLAGDWPAFYSRLRGAKSRRRLREKANRLAKIGPVRLRRVRGTQELSTVISRLLVWKTDKLDDRGSRNPFADGRMQQLLCDFAVEHPDSDMLRIYVMEVGGRPVAATVALIHDGVFNFFIPAFDDTGIRNCSPGTIMLVKLIELSARAGYSKFDFSLGDEGYKEEWCDVRVEMTHQTEALNLRGAATCAVLRAGLKLKRYIKTNHRLFALLEAVNARRISVLRRFSTTPAAAS